MRQQSATTIQLSGNNSPHERNSKVRRKEFNLTNIISNYLLPVLFRIALFGLYVLFFIFKVILALFQNSTSFYYKSKSAFVSQRKKREPQSKKRVIIIGGGYAGTHAAKKLQHDFDVTLMDSKDYYEFTPSRLRTLVEPHHVYKVKMSYDQILSKARVINERVHYITEDEVITESQSVFKYHYLIVATGSRYHETIFPRISDQHLPPTTMNAKVLSARTANFELYYYHVQQANRVLVIGGGTVGVELAGEITSKFPEKQVTLIHSQTQLMNRSPQKVGKHAEEFFKGKNVTVVTGERITEQTGTFFKTDLGSIHEADIAFVCTGNVPNSELFNPGFTESLNRYGFVRVNQFLQLRGFTNIFVAGDLTDIPEEEEKLCQTAYEEIKIVIQNIRNFDANKELTPYMPSPCPMLISLGKYDGICTYRGYSITGFIPAVMKEFVEWKEMVFYWTWQHFKLQIAETQKRMGLDVMV